MEKHHHIEGLVAAPFTPMDADGGINLNMIEKQADFLHRNGVVGAFVCGTTGESMLLTVPERLDIAKRWVETAPDGFMVIIHIGHTSLQACKTLASNARDIGAWGVGSMAPCFFRPESVDDLVAFCAEAAAAAPDLPFYYYHMPSVTGVNFPMVDFLKAAADKIPNLAGIKFTYENLMDYELCRKLDNGRFDMLFGRDELLICGLALGARGAVGSTYNFAAPLYNHLIEAFDNGDLETARTLQRKSMEMIQVLVHTPASFNAVAKAVLKILGLDCGPVRQPLANITPQQEDNLKSELDKIGFFEYCSK